MFHLTLLEADALQCILSHRLFDRTRKVRSQVCDDRSQHTFTELLRCVADTMTEIEIVDIETTLIVKGIFDISAPNKAMVIIDLDGFQVC